MSSTSRWSDRVTAVTFVALWAVAGVITTVMSAPTAVALPIAGTFVLFGPGLAVALLLRLTDLAAVLTVTIGASLAALVLSGQLLLVLEVYRPELVVFLLSGLTVLCCLGTVFAAGGRAQLETGEVGA